jgi:mRNA interferase RelE/StbE
LRSYRLVFKAGARKEWDKLAPSTRDQFKRKLAERLASPHVPAAKLSGMPDCYKIKLKALGYRLVYRVEDERLVVLVLSVGRRDRGRVYKLATRRLEEPQ